MFDKKAFIRMTTILCATVATSAIAAEYTLKYAPQSLADWKNGAFYEGGVAPTEGSAAIVHVPNGLEVTFTDDTICFANSLSRISPTNGAYVVFNVSTNSQLSLAVDSQAYSGSYSGTLVKQGAGDLVLSSSRANKVNLDIQNGALFLAKVSQSSDFVSTVFAVKIGENGVFVPAVNSYSSSSKGITWCSGVTGTGLITNAVSSASVNCRLSPNETLSVPYVFNGRIQGAIQVYVMNGYQHFMGSGSSYSRLEVAPTIYKGNNGVLGFGGVSELGAGGVYVDTGSRFVYFGNGNETIGHTLFLLNYSGSTNSPVLDAGASGGLNFTGLLRLYSDNTAERLELAGTNASPCTFSGEIRALYNDGLTYFTKTGSGTWRFANYTGSNRTGIGGLWIKEGTLGFETFNETNVVGALGKTKFFIDDLAGSLNTVARLPYFFKLGDASTEGTMDWYGAGRIMNATRPAALAGTGRIMHGNADGYMHYTAGVSSLVEGGRLVLDGANDSYDTVTDLSDGDGTLAIEKRGSGTWTIKGTNNTFTGGIDVKAGKLILCGVSGKFSWYRWTIRETHYWDLKDEGTTGMDAYPEISEFGLWDEDGSRVNGGLTYAPDAYTSLGNNRYKSQYNRANHPKIAPGEVCFDNGLVLFYNPADGGNLAKMFDGIQNFMYNRVVTNDVVATMKEGYPDTYMPILMRLDPSKKAAKQYDVSSRYSYYAKGNSNRRYAVYMAKSWLLEGSVDGERWYVADDVTDAPWSTVNSNFKWYYANVVLSAANASVHSNGRTIEGYTNDTVVVYSAPVSVAVDAVLEAEGLVKLSALKVDASTAAGTVRGFMLADDLHLDISNLPKGASVTLPLKFEDVVGNVDVSRWTFTKDGKDSANLLASYSNGEISVHPRGMIMTFR